MTKIEVYDVEAEWLEQFADEEGTTVAEIVEMIISEYLEGGLK